MAVRMTQHEYEFMTGRWKGVKGAAFNTVYKFCREFGWIKEMSHGPDKPTLTYKGMQALKEYKKAHE